MPMIYYVAVILAIGIVALAVGRQRASAQTRGRDKQHSRPHYHGWWAMLLATIPAILLVVVWSIGSTIYVERHIEAQIPEQTDDSPIASRSLAIGMIHNLADALRRLDAEARANLPATFAELQPKLAAKGAALAPDTQDYMIAIAAGANAESDTLRLTGGVLALILALAGAAYGLRSIHPRAQARNKVERIVLWALLGSSMIAILTTVGIVLSMLFETFHFFSSVSPLSFFFGTVWDPRFAAAGAGDSAGQFGLIPLLAGTLYIALVALLVAVPIGLMSAVYMAEYASRRVRSIVKPALELLAGIPTIVYGIFALVTLGPFLRDLSAALTGGTPFIQAQSIFTAGVVMGIMLIPVVSSLSDDIITAVPRAMRDGSLGLGATRSETIKRVVLPAALPGIVGAILLTASRAIGETMIVVLAAGVAAKLTANPFEAMTTITVKIVNQLTGDLEFNSPQTLVAFALGLTLFAVTLVMNIVALYIVRKYREQYE
ncbi:MAG: phosphate ABC transporter permease subunit PstC [Rhizobiaceae bacterium]|nr:phosphate ABC transporter permease subunit PstC [Rhizobiaceae bacterium]